MRKLGFPKPRADSDAALTLNDAALTLNLARAHAEGMEKELPSSGPEVEGDTLNRSLDLDRFRV